jgi:hypothetical protein
MAQLDSKSMPIPAAQGMVMNSDPRDSTSMPDETEGKQMTNDDRLAAWVMERVSAWRIHRDSNYSTLWDEYERKWRAIYTPEDKTKKKERAKLISPATAEAVENGVAEIEEAVFGRGDFLKLMASPDDGPVEREALERNESTFRYDLDETDLTSTCSETIMNSAVYGTGIGEIILEKETKRDIMAVMDEAAGRLMPQVRETIMERPVLRSVNPRNFGIDPAARDIESALGVFVEEDVSEHIIRAGITSGEYKKVDLKVGSSGNPDIKPDPQMETPWMQDVVHIIRYYGKVPKELIFPPQQTEELFPEDKKEDATPLSGEMVEAWVVLASEGQLLMAKETPDMMKDRPVLAVQWDIVPGRFWGRGICEKGATAQRLLDAELRYRIDCLAFTAAPMIAMDGSRLPRGFKFDIYPGKNILVNGDPKQVLQPFKFGELDVNSGAQIELLDQMVQRATGSVDGMALAKAGVGGDARSGAVSMALSGIVKRNKRTLLRYINRFLTPALRKLFWRYVQYNPERYIPINMTFGVSSTMGIMQREYETSNMTQLISGMQPGSLEHILLMIGIVSNSGMHGRDKILAALQEKAKMLSQPAADPNAPVMDPVLIQLQRMDAQLELATKKAKLAEIQAKTRLLDAQARSEMLEPMMESQRIATKGIYKTPEEQIDEEFDRRMRIAQMALEKEQMESDERIAAMQTAAAKENKQIHVQEVPKAVPVPVPVGVTLGQSGVSTGPIPLDAGMI